QRGLADVLGGTGVWIVGLAALGLWFGAAGLPRVPFEVRARLRSIATSRGRWTLAITAGTLASAWVISASLGRSPAVVSSRKPNVLLIAADSLRPDRLDSRRAPNLAALAQHATTFERAYTPLARTFPAWVSISTGKYPHHHGIRNMFPRWETRERHFDTLAEHFGQAGYQTAVVGDFAADIFRRIDLGYQEVRTPTFTMRELVREHLLKNDPWLLAWVRGSFMRWLCPVVVEMHEATDPSAVTGEALDVIDRSRERPLFLTVFYSTPHFPYAAPGPHHRRFAVSGYAGPFRYAKADTLNAAEQLTAADITQVRALYDGAVYATDEAIGELLDALKKRGFFENAIVVVTADHGEQLYEYSRTQGHGDHLYGDESLRVPLVIATPGLSRANRVAEPVSLVDLAPTLLELAHVAPLDGIDGRSLVTAMGGQLLPPKPIYSETGLWFTELIAEVPLRLRIPYPDLTLLTEVDRQHGDQVVIRPRWQAVTTAAKHRMLQLGQWRLIYMPTRAGPVLTLCDLSSDLGCNEDASPAHPDRAAALKALLWQLVADDPEVIRQGELLLPSVAATPPTLGAPP
ncbi:MAG TPA: sulfatase, partial [Polyangiaceae bacterium]